MEKVFCHWIFQTSCYQDLWKIYFKKFSFRNEEFKPNSRTPILKNNPTVSDSCSILVDIIYYILVDIDGTVFYRRI